MYKEKIINNETGEITFRDYTSAEIAEVEAAIIETQIKSEQAETRATVRASALAKLAALGLTADEIAAL